MRIPWFAMGRDYPVYDGSTMSSGGALDPRLLRAFTVLAEELHFGRAARRLHVAQPAVSQQLQRLEDQLGVRLFERSTQHVSLTAEGEAVLPYARQAVAAATAVERAAQEAAGSIEATLAVGLSPGVHYLAERALARLAETDPHVRVGAIAANTGSVARQVADGTLEIGLGFATQPARGVRLEAIAEVPAVAAVASAHPLAVPADRRASRAGRPAPRPGRPARRPRLQRRRPRALPRGGLRARAGRAARRPDGVGDRGAQRRLRRLDDTRVGGLDAARHPHDPARGGGRSSGST